MKRGEREREREFGGGRPFSHRSSISFLFSLVKPFSHFALVSSFLLSPVFPLLQKVDRSLFSFLWHFPVFTKSSFALPSFRFSLLFSSLPPFLPQLFPPPSAAAALSPASQSKASLTPSLCRAEIPATFQGRSEAREEEEGGGGGGGGRGEEKRIPFFLFLQKKSVKQNRIENDPRKGGRGLRRQRQSGPL